MATPLEDLTRLLGQITTSGSFATRRTAAPGDLRLNVKGVGRLRLPLTATQALELCAIGRPARHGYKDQTRLDRRVRDTWEIPKSRVSIDQRAWHRTLRPQLDAIRRDIGLGDRGLKAELHDMLVYGPGQFFVTHQDSEKADDMVGTLVVILPSAFAGGEMVIEHHDEKATFGGSRSQLTFIAFYADCHHQVRPITRGYRVALTYNLMLEGDAGTEVAPPRQIDALAQHVRRFFDTRPPARWAHDKEREPPDRLVYLLDHEYTPRGLGWNRLKNADAVRVAALREVARDVDAEIALALADVHETWSYEDESFGYDRRYGYGRRSGHGRGWSRFQDDEIEGEDAGALRLTDLVDSDVELRHWVGSGELPKGITTGVDAAELCYTKASVTMQPFKSEHEGYMGNWGNTVDRWYHRAAVVLWPRERRFVIQAKASAHWAMGEVAAALEAGDRDAARRMTEQLKPFWARAAQHESSRGFLDRTLLVAAGLDAADLAAVLLGPFSLTRLTAKAARRLVPLHDRHGLEWCRALLDRWASDRPHAAADDRARWLASTLPDVCRALCAGESPDGADLARIVVEGQWTWIARQWKQAGSHTHPKQSREALAALANPWLGVLESSVVAGHGDLHREMVELLVSTDAPVAAVAHLLRKAHERHPIEARRSLGLAPLHARCVQDLTARLAAPARGSDDWSISTPVRCPCTLCPALTRFLRSPDEITLAWPLAKEQRRHVHGIVDLHDLPVRHVTQRSGRPYTLVLTKTDAVFTRDASERKAWKGELTWLNKTATAF